MADITSSSKNSNHCHKPHHLKKCTLCFFIFILINPSFVYSAEIQTTLPTTTTGKIHKDPHGVGSLKEKSVEARLSFVKRLFDKYGQNGTMTFEAFEHLLYSLGLVKTIKDNHVVNHDLSAHIQDGKFKDIHNHDKNGDKGANDAAANEMYNLFFGPKKDKSDLSGGPHEKEHSHNHDSHNHDSHDHDSHDHSSHDHGHDARHPESSNHRDVAPGSTTQAPSSRAKRSVSNSNCMSATEIFQSLNMSTTLPIKEKDFVKICPALIYLIDGHTCGARSQGHHHDDHHQDHGDHDHHGNESDAQGPVKVFNAPLIVWGYALLSVFIISLVGLLGVAIVPVMQKVFYNHLLQFLVALAVGSLVGDALLHLLPHSLLPHNHGGSHDHDSHGHSKQGIYKGLVAFAGVYFFFLTERIMGLVTAWRRRINQKKNKKVTETVSSPKLLGDLADQETDSFKLTKTDSSCEEAMMMVHPSKDLRNMAEDMHEHIHRDCGKDDNKRISHSHGGSGHNHGHGHSHDVPDSVASVAWMVIMGDGLHNLSDGLAIGAAFANSMTGGLSTSIAVFCHELPHELGDFAMLLRAGMSVRQALVYNCVSSILCLIGMIVGVAAGNIESVSLWIFALAGGMFIYIALVDMLPEMINNAPKHGENPVWHLILQNVGILLGSGIMLVIALYEDKIQVPDVFP